MSTCRHGPLEDVTLNRSYAKHMPVVSTLDGQGLGPHLRQRDWGWRLRWGWRCVGVIRRPQRAALSLNRPLRVALFL